MDLTPNQLVAYNLRRARELRGLTQEEAAAALEPYLGERWSKALFSNAERSVDGKRVRPFDADELVAFSRAFGLPVVWFLLPPEQDSVIASPDPTQSITANVFLGLLFDLNDEAAGGQVRARLGELLDAMPRQRRTAAQRKVDHFAEAQASILLGQHVTDLFNQGDVLRKIADLLDQVAGDMPSTTKEDR